MHAMFNRMAIAGKLMSVAGLSIGLLLIVGFSVVIFQSNAVVDTLSRDATTAQADSETNALETDITAIEAAAQSMAASLTALHQSGNRDRNLAMSVLKPNVNASPMVLGSWFFAEPNGYDGQDANMTAHSGSRADGAFMPYWIKQDGGVAMQPNTETGVYSADYYKLAHDSGRGAITEPYPYQVGGKTITMTSVAFPVKAGGKVIGVAGLDIALDDISERLAALKPFGTGKVMLLSGNGLWVAHHDPALRMKPYADTGLDRVKAAIASGKTDTLDNIEIDGVAVERTIRPIKFKGLDATWALVLDVPEATISAPARSLAWQLIVGGILIVGASLAGLFYAARSIIGRPMAALSGTVDRLAKGENLAVPETDRHDEIGTMARAADVFRQAAADRAAADARSAQEQKLITSAIGEGLSALTDGDLTTEIRADFPGAYAVLKTNFNEAVTGLRQMIGTVTDSATAIRTGSQEIAQASEDLARRTEANAASLEETSAALVQIDDRLKASAVNASKTVERADEAISTVSGGRSVADEAVQAMDRVRGSAKGIDEVIEGVDKIAFQTRVLAMNAAVEAGRAGEAGRGFAVVADLVSALAMRAEEEAKKARDQLTLTQTDIGTAVEAVQRVDNALASIADGVGEVHSLLGEMARDNQAQSSAITQISVAVGTMDQATQQNAAMVEETSAAARNLNSEVASLTEQAAQFRTDAGQPVAAAARSERLAA
ncbi:methyl-accepting chemotaxis protein [Sphingomonas sp. DBB INV C78]|uniref:methyl-accepting chemotaxis protein n=1 Tax=Sphingomonas sp. DBB INV C78 TaxID=3349434 RepID=UPI0036D2510C